VDAGACYCFCCFDYADDANVDSVANSTDDEEKDEDNNEDNWGKLV
jgi:hypothetical protein